MRTAELAGDHVSKLMDVELRGIDGVIRQLTDRHHQLALILDARDDGTLPPERMGPPGLAEPADQNFVVRLQKYQGHGKGPLDLGVYLRKP